ncbi:ATP-binding cassette sub-family C member 4-like, partial [Saccoglossus kowalevskii]|uniref:Multidrug resistance-associated protein 4-like n=1 Tax=Saccoglossus kowalevskii TaxID=10224 RepID=A0ABM0M477_SACKO
WLNPLFKYGYKNKLEVTDMYETMPEDSSEQLANKLEKQWNKELCKQKNRKPSLTRAIIRTFGVKYMLIGIIVFLEETVKVIQPLLLGQLISYFSPGSTKTQTEAYLYAFGVSICAFLLIVTHHPYFHCTQVIGMRIRICCCALIYRKALTLSNKALGETTTGQIVNLLSNDVNRFDQ